MKFATLSSSLLHAGAAAGLYYGSSVGGAPSTSTVCIENAVPVIWETPSFSPPTKAKTSGDHKKSPTTQKLHIDSHIHGNDKGNPQDRGDRDTRKDKSAKNGLPCETHDCIRPFTASPQNQSPAYPEKARQRELEGQGMMRLYLTKNGHVARMEMLTPLDPLFIEEAEKALKTWRFQGTLPTYVDVPLDFRLKD